MSLLLQVLLPYCVNSRTKADMLHSVRFFLPPTDMKYEAIIIFYSELSQKALLVM